MILPLVSGYECFSKLSSHNTQVTYSKLFKVNIKAPERHNLRFFGVFIDNFQQISRIFLVFLLLTLNK